MSGRGYAFGNEEVARAFLVSPYTEADVQRVMDHDGVVVVAMSGTMRERTKKVCGEWDAEALGPPPKEWGCPGEDAEPSRKAHNEERSSPAGVYSETATEELDESVAAVPERVYVPNVGDGTVVVVDSDTFRIVDRYAVGENPYHVTPSWDLKKLYVNNEATSSLTEIDPKTGKPTGFVSVPTRITCTSPRTGRRRSWWSSACRLWSFATPILGGCSEASTSLFQAWTTWTSPPRATTSSPAASGAGW